MDKSLRKMYGKVAGEGRYDIATNRTRKDY